MNWGKECPSSKGLARQGGVVIDASIYKFQERDMQNSGGVVYHIRWKIQAISQWNHIILAILQM